MMAKLVKQRVNTRAVMPGSTRRMGRPVQGQPEPTATQAQLTGDAAPGRGYAFQGLQQQASGQGCVEEHVGQQDAAKPIEVPARQPAIGQPGQPALPAKDTDQAGDGDNGGQNQAQFHQSQQQAATGEYRAAGQRHGDGQPDRQTEQGRQCRLPECERQDPAQVRLLPELGQRRQRCLPEQGGEAGHGHDQQDAGGRQARPDQPSRMPERCLGHQRLMASNHSSSHALRCSATVAGSRYRV